MACNTCLHQTMVSAIAQPSKAPQRSYVSLSPSSNSNSKSSCKLVLSSQSSFISGFSRSRPRPRPQTLIPFRSGRAPTSLVVECGNNAHNAEPLRIMISGAPASGKGTQCELITQKYGLVHVAAGDLLRAEIESGSENGRRAKEYMEQGKLVPDEIVVMMVKDRLLQPDSQAKGWLLDGYPRSSSQAIALKELGFKPDLFILLEVPEDILVERVVGRRLDPITGKIYHLKYSPPETQEIEARLTHRFDDTEEKVKLRLNTHHQNVEAVLSMYEDITIKINGSVTKEDVFAQIDSELERVLEKRQATSGSLAA